MQSTVAFTCLETSMLVTVETNAIVEVEPDDVSIYGVPLLHNEFPNNILDKLYDKLFDIKMSIQSYICY